MILFLMLLVFVATIVATFTFGRMFSKIPSAENLFTGYNGENEENE